MKIESRTGFISASSFERLWEVFIESLEAGDPQAFYTTSGEHRLDASLAELKSALRNASVERKN